MVVLKSEIQTHFHEAVTKT